MLLTSQPACSIHWPRLTQPHCPSDRNLVDYQLTAARRSRCGGQGRHAAREQEHLQLPLSAALLAQPSSFGSVLLLQDDSAIAGFGDSLMLLVWSDVCVCVYARCAYAGHMQIERKISQRYLSLGQAT